MSPCRPTFFLSVLARRGRDAPSPALGFRFPAEPAAIVVGIGGSHARDLEGWRGSDPSAGVWLSSSLLSPPYGSRDPLPLSDFEPAVATWAGTGRAGSGRVQAGWNAGGCLWPAHPGGYVMWPDPRTGLREGCPCHLQLVWLVFLVFLVFFLACPSVLKEKEPNKCFKEFRNHVCSILFPACVILAWCVVPCAALGNMEGKNQPPFEK